MGWTTTFLQLGHHPKREKGTRPQHEGFIPVPQIYFICSSCSLVFFPCGAWWCICQVSNILEYSSIACRESETIVTTAANQNKEKFRRWELNDQANCLKRRKSWTSCMNLIIWESGQVYWQIKERVRKCLRNRGATGYCVIKGIWIFPYLNSRKMAGFHNLDEFYAVNSSCNYINQVTSLCSFCSCLFLCFGIVIVFFYVFSLHRLRSQCFF